MCLPLSKEVKSSMPVPVPVVPVVVFGMHPWSRSSAASVAVPRPPPAGQARDVAPYLPEEKRKRAATKSVAVIYTRSGTPRSALICSNCLIMLLEAALW